MGTFNQQCVAFSVPEQNCFIEEFVFPHIMGDTQLINYFSKEVANITAKARTALSFCKSRSMNQAFCLLIDMSVHSGKKRFFV